MVTLQLTCFIRKDGYASDEHSDLPCVAGTVG